MLSLFFTNGASIQTIDLCIQWLRIRVKRLFKFQLWGISTQSLIFSERLIWFSVLCKTGLACISMISFASIGNLFSKLYILFKIFVTYNILIKLTKTYLNSLDIGHLGQRVNSLGLTISDDKLRTIQLLHYLDTLGALEYYLGWTGYLCSYIHFYTKLTKPLQSLKTFFLKCVLVSGAQRRVFTLRTKLPLTTPSKKASFLRLEKTLS